MKSTSPTDKVEILMRCSRQERERIKAKAEAAKLTVNDYLRRAALQDNRHRNVENSAALMPLYIELRELNQKLQTMPITPLIERAIEIAQEAQRKIVLHRVGHQEKEAEDESKG